MKSRVFHLGSPNIAVRAAICCVFALATTAGSIVGDPPQRTASKECGAAIDCRLVQISDQPAQESPFLWQGKVVGDPDEDIPEKMRKLLEGPVRKYPSLASCVSNPKMIAQDLGQAKLRWSEFRSRYEAEVCLFRLFDGLGNTDMISAWLAKLGFTEFRLRKGEDAYWDSFLTGAPEVEFEATWNLREKGSLYGGWFNRLVRQLGGNSFTVYGVVAKPNELKWVFIKERSKFQK